MAEMNELLSRPIVLFVSACEMTPESVIQKVISGPLPEGIIMNENITAYPWFLDNKYYTADVNLCSMQSQADISVEIAHLVNAVILCFDGTNPTGLDEAYKWSPYLGDCEQEINFLVCKSYETDIPNPITSSQRVAYEWCLTKFELIALEQKVDDPEEDFCEATGIERIIEGLNAHQWPNLVLKSDNRHESLEEEFGGDSFGDLFSQLPELRAYAASASDTVRRDIAEQIVRSFLHALDEHDFDEL